MGFFNKLFGNSNSNNNQKKVRAQFKDAKYFFEQIERCDRFIKSDSENEIEYLKTHVSLNAAHYLSSATIRNKKSENYFSLGESIENIQPIFIESLNYFSKGWSEDFQDYSLLLKMVSLGVLLNVSSDDFNKINYFIKKTENSSIEEIWKPDSLIYYLIGQPEKIKTGDKAYEMLYKITQLPKQEAEIAIKEYLEKWYNLHKEDPWYNTHLRDKGYSGYWAWEVGAVVKVMELDDSSFKDNPYYPYDMVHWK